MDWAPLAGQALVSIEDPVAIEQILAHLLEKSGIKRIQPVAREQDRPRGGLIVPGVKCRSISPDSRKRVFVLRAYLSYLACVKIKA